MNKSKLFVIIAILALLVISLCACTDNKPAPSKPQTSPASQAVTEALSDSTAEISDVNNTASSEISSEPYQGENDLEIITVPQNNSEDSENTDPAQTVTKAEVETKASEPATEVQKIELPFVPVS